MKNLIILSSVLSTVVLASPVAAQDDLQFDINNTRSCLFAATTSDQKRQCIGQSATACMNATSSGGTTYGMGGCLNFEAEWWDTQLNAAYGPLMKREKQDDAQNDADGFNAPKKAPALRAMQRAWITYRDTTCGYEYSQWGGGTGGGPASVACVLRMTGEQTIYLQSAGLEY
ncbi:MAG: hypothetical protein ACI861_000011 [Paracoccaceae bacterium]|jgi:uncharacterized protein YecT (DUF1311 family)